jgi:hypothetical protein
MDGRQVGFSQAIELIEAEFKLSSPLENLSLTVRFNVERQRSSNDSLFYLQSHVEAQLIEARFRLGLTKYVRLLTALDLTTDNLRNKRVSAEQFREVMQKLLSKIPDV